MFTLKLPRRDEHGFTLIELLVVIIIIGILAAIAIPLFLDQRKLAVDASVKSDVRNTATQVQTWQAQNPGAIATDATDYTSQGGKLAATSGNTVGVTVASDGSYLVCGYVGSAKTYTGANTAYVFDSSTGKFGSGSCTGGIVGSGNPSSNPSTSAPAPASPVASFTVSTNGLTVSVDPTATTNTSGLNPYYFDFGDGSTSRVSGATTYTYATSGDYTITLTARNGVSGPTGTATRSVSVTNFTPVVVYSENYEAGNTPYVNGAQGSIANSDTTETGMVSGTSNCYNGSNYCGSFDSTTFTNGRGYAYKTATIVPGATYVYTAKVRAGRAGSKLTSIGGFAQNGTTVSDVTYTPTDITSWGTVTYKFVAGSTGTYNRFGLTWAYSGATTWTQTAVVADDVTLTRVG
jgi:type IV pilus assembly protein PilA